MPEHLTRGRAAPFRVHRAVLACPSRVVHDEAVRTSQQRAAAAQRAAATSSAVGGAGRRVLARLRAAASADGAGQSGLAALLWTHALQAAGDALIAVALAGTVFFSVPLGQARSRVALYLVLTLLPFSLLVPVAGPLLDRFRHG